MFFADVTSSLTESTSQTRQNTTEAIISAFQEQTTSTDAQSTNIVPFAPPKLYDINLRQSCVTEQIETNNDFSMYQIRNDNAAIARCFSDYPLSEIFTNYTNNREQYNSTPYTSNRSLTDLKTTEIQHGDALPIVSYGALDSAQLSAYRQIDNNVSDQSALLCRTVSSYSSQLNHRFLRKDGSGSKMTQYDPTVHTSQNCFCVQCYGITPNSKFPNYYGAVDVEPSEGRC